MYVKQTCRVDNIRNWVARRIEWRQHIEQAVRKKKKKENYFMFPKIIYV